MEPEWVSAWAAVVSAGFALVAVVVSGWALVIANRGSTATERAAETGARQYRFSAQPNVGFKLVIDRPERRTPDMIPFHVEITRDGGPIELWWQAASASYSYVTPRGWHSGSETYFPGRVMWRKIDSYDEVPEPNGYEALIDLQIDEQLLGLNVTLDCEFCDNVRDGQPTDGAEIWRKSVYLNWTPQTRIGAL